MADVEVVQENGIVEMYEEAANMWDVEQWGEHQHEGFCDIDSPVSGLTPDFKLAKTRTIEEALLFAGFSSENPEKRPRNVVDVGCGIGGSSRHIAKKYGANCQGITLGATEVQRATALSVAEGLADKVSFQVADATEQPFADGQFDLVWSMSSSEHVHDKRKFVSELVRVAAPGGTVIIVSYFHRNLDSSEESLQPRETELLEKIGELSFSKWCSAADLIKLLQSHCVEDIKTADWTPHVASFALARSSSRPCVGPKTTKGGKMAPLMVEGYEMGLIKFGIITCRKSL
ncbi:hypothetical protein Tsubulata_003401 [Turnera subulata]|uniref:Methyltransferase type 11 domain-containing protein n=1 Tax=Turnera subulata TaxID=218843 RepID=A0A9Q0FFE8_9ROSI|nr:hypothetical protein Tsubulata_003401 [Turnera subulata]